MPVSTESFSIVIVGGGIAGLAAAIALRAPGRRIIILESSLMNKEIGAAISLQPNAVKILQKWGLENYFLANGGSPDGGFQIYRTDGHLQMKIRFNKEDYGADRLLFHRVDLHQALKSVAVDPKRPGPPAEIRLGCGALSADCEAGIVFCQSGEEFKADLIIGADGIVGETKHAVPTGLSAYRMTIPRDDLLTIPHVSAMMTDEETWTTMLFGHSCRVVMGPCRNKEFLSIVALVPDEKMFEQASGSWTSEGSKDDLLRSFADFPPWIKSTFDAAPSASLWQLRDMDPLSTWVKGRTILIGDAAHSMLPTQGQGASQSFEDAEALQAFFEEIEPGASYQDVNALLGNVFDARYKRASTIQGYSRQAARPATESGKTEITMNPQEFMEYNCNYKGAKAWVASQ